MKPITATILSLIISVSQAFASTGTTGSDDLGLLAIGFISFGVLIILFQFVPVLLLIAGMIAGLFKAGEKKNEHELSRANKSA